MFGNINSMSWLKTINFFVLTFAFCTSSAWAAQSSNIANGVAAYNKGWYSTALHYLTLAESQYPNNALIHYYRANTLVHLTKTPEAMQEYDRAAELDPRGTTGNYARQALQVANNDTVSSTAVTQQALLKQANSLSTHFSQRAQTVAASRLEQGQNRYNQIMQRQKIEVERMNRTGYNSGGGIDQDGNPVTGWMPAYSPDYIAAYAERKAAQAANTLSMAQRDAAAMSSRAAQRSQNINESAASLAQQLANPQPSAGVQLSPVGTNLYVRNYILTPGSDNISNQGIPEPVPIKGLGATAGRLIQKQ